MTALRSPSCGIAEAAAGEDALGPQPSGDVVAETQHVAVDLLDAHVERAGGGLIALDPVVRLGL